MSKKIRYSSEPQNRKTYTESYDRFYSRFAPLYYLFVKLFPLWRRWIRRVLPHVRGPRILEISFGTGYLFDLYDRNVEICGVEYNQEMIAISKRWLDKGAGHIRFQQADVLHLPFKSGVFDTVVNTMAFSGYPDGDGSLAEMNRVLSDGGRVVMVDVNFPQDGNWMGVRMARLWERMGDILRDMDAVFQKGGFEFSDEEIGGWGSVHLYVARKVD